MKKFINHIDNILAESLSGFAIAHEDLVSLNLEPNFLTRKHKASNKVAIISGGGSGHEPLHAGYIGKGMLDAACPGHVFTSPTPDQMLAAAEAVHADKGILFIVKNYAGDVMNFDIGSELAADEGIPVKTVIINDDVASAPLDKKQNRRGVAGLVPVTKLAGAAATQVDSLDELALVWHSPAAQFRLLADLLLTSAIAILKWA